MLRTPIFTMQVKVLGELIEHQVEDEKTRVYALKKASSIPHHSAHKCERKDE